MSTQNQNLPGVNEYRDSMNDLQFSEEAKARMAARLAEAATADASAADAPADVVPFKAPRKRRLPFVAAIILALVLATGGAAYATGGLAQLGDLIGQLFGAEEPQVEIVEHIGRPLGVSQSVNGVTISADAVIGDTHNVAVVFSVVRDDGEPFEHLEPMEGGLLPYTCSSTLNVGFGPFEGGSATGCEYFYDANPEDPAIQIVEIRSFEHDGAGDFSVIGRTLTADFTDIAYFGDEAEELEMVAPGSWHLEFPLNYEDTSVKLPAGTDFDLNGVEATIDSASISPIALHMEYTAQAEANWTSTDGGQMTDHDSQLSDTLLGVTASVTMTDGSVVELVPDMGGMIEADGKVSHCEINIIFDRIINLDEVASVTIGGTTIEL